jgi:hypothetical protein
VLSRMLWLLGSGLLITAAWKGERVPCEGSPSRRILQAFTSAVQAASQNQMNQKTPVEYSRVGWKAEMGCNKTPS